MAEETFEETIARGFGAFAERVPRDIAENLAFRRQLRKMCLDNEKYRNRVFLACQSDPLFFFNSLCFGFEPRPKVVGGKSTSGIFPFIAWEHQVPMMKLVHENLGLRDVACVAADTPIVTDRGLVPIQDVTSCHRVFDGIGFVHCEGAVLKGVKKVVDAYGIRMTADHQVLTTEGWADAEKRLPRAEVRGFGVRGARRQDSCLEMQVRRDSDCSDWRRPKGGCRRRHAAMSVGLSAERKPQQEPRRKQVSDVREVGCDAKSVRKHVECSVPTLWRSRNHSVRAVVGVRKLPRGYGRVLFAGSHARASGQRQWIQPGELRLGRSQDSGIESPKQSLRGAEWRKGNRGRGGEAGRDRRVVDAGAHRKRQGCSGTTEGDKGIRHDSRTNDNRSNGIGCRNTTSHDANADLQLQVATGAMARAWKGSEVNQEVATYDIVNCGPRRRFVAVGRDGRMVILHNCEKSRGEGMSWTLVLFATWDWIFNDMRAIGLVSKDENAVDNPDDPDSLFWKIDFLISKMPRWLVGDKDVDWKRDRGKHVLKNFRNGSTITGYAATGNVASGGRKSWFAMDELGKFPRGPDADAMASTQHVTNCRVIVSTPKGADGAYYKLMHEPSTSMAKCRLHWTMNPTRNRGMYNLIDGRAVAVDPIENPLTPEYRDMTPEILERLENLRKKGYILEGKPRSPWYDNECDRAGATPQNIAQELDIDYGGSAFRIFGNDCMGRIKETIKPDVIRGNIDFSKEDLEPTFDELPNGPLRLWMPLDQRRLPPNHAFVVGCDICTGMGGSYTSNSSLVIIDAVTKEEVGEFVSNVIPPGDFADFAIAVCKWLNNAFLAWEHNGPGNGFTKRVIERGYTHVYYRTDQSVRKKTKTKKLGWWTSTDSKEVMFDALRMSLRSGELTIRSGEMAEELGQYIRKGPLIFNSLSQNAAEDSQGSSHGDRVIGLGVAWMAMKDYPGLVAHKQQADRSRIPPMGSLAERMEEYDRSLKKKGSTWDTRSLGDFAKGR